MDKVSDLDLLKRTARGDGQAFHRLADRHAKGLYGLAHKLAGNSADAEDLLQETLLGAYRQAGQFQARSSVKTWLTKILVRQASKLYRWRRVRRIDAQADVADDSNSAGAVVASPANAADRSADVQAMLATLSEEHRQVLVLRELQGLSYDEIAEVLGVPQGTVESRLFRARQAIKQRFAGYMQT